MRALTLSVVTLGALAFAVGAHAAPAFNTDECPERTSSNFWCPSELVKEVWVLKYRSESSPQLMDAYWMHEVWIRGRTALVCSNVGGRGGIRFNQCMTLDEVDR